MVEITRRGMLGGVAMGGLLWNTAALSSELRQPPYGPAPAPLDGPELPSFRYPLGAPEDRDLQRRHRQGGQRHRLPGVGQARRRLHDARAGRAPRAALARQCRRMGLCARGQLPRHHHRSGRPMRDRRFRPRRCLVFPARPRPFDPRARARHLHLPSRVRQRLFLGVRHLLDHRLARPYAAETCSPGISALPASTFADFPKKEVYIATGPVPPPLAARSRRQARRTSRRSPIAIACSPPSPRVFAGGTLRRVSATRVPDLDHHDRRAAGHRARRLARAALAPARRRVAVLHQGHRPHDRVRQPRPRPHR